MQNVLTGPVLVNASITPTICCPTAQCHVTSVNGIQLLTAEMSSILQFKLKQMVRASGLQLLTLTMTNSYGDKIRMDEFTIKQLAKCGYLTNMEADLRLLEQISSGISTVIMRIQRFTLKPFQINWVIVALTWQTVSIIKEQISCSTLARQCIPQMDVSISNFGNNFSRNGFQFYLLNIL